MNLFRTAGDVFGLGFGSYIIFLKESKGAVFLAHDDPKPLYAFVFPLPTSDNINLKYSAKNGVREAPL